MSRALLLALLVVGLVGLGFTWPLLRPAQAAAQAAAGRPLQPGASEVVEVLRLKVPAEQRGCWREAEALTWEPWLNRQAGYQGRELFWDAERQEGVLLIGWARRADWGAIPPEAVAEVQARFEAQASRCLGLEPGSANPFPLLSGAELLPER